MNIHHEFKTGKGEFLAVKMPNDVYPYAVVGNVLWYYKDKGEEGFKYIKLNIQSAYELICTTNSVTEEQAEDVVDKKYGWEINYFYDYKGYNQFKNPLESFNSLLEREKLYRVNPFQIQVVMNGLKGMDKEWQQAEERTGNWVILKKI